MNALEKKALNLFDEHKKKFGEYPKYVSCTIRWNDDKEYVKNTIFSLREYNADIEKDDDKIFFYVIGIGELLTLCANIDFTIDSFDSADEFIHEVNLYDTDDENDQDYSYLHRGEDFCIVDVEEFFDEL